MKRGGAQSNHQRRSLLNELKERKVLRVTVAYVIVAWAIMQVGDLVFSALHLPDWSISLLVVILFLGFPIALVLAWAYELTPEGLQPDATARAQKQRSPDAHERGNTIAVLPFEDLSPEGDHEFFCKGIAEEITGALSRIEGLRVISRISFATSAALEPDVHEAGRKLGADMVLSGSYRSDGDTSRISARLTCTTDGQIAWHRQFKQSNENAFALQEEIAHDVAKAMQLGISSRSGFPLATGNTHAYEFFLHGLGYFTRGGAANNRLARHMFRKATEIDPGFCRAWANLSFTHACDYLYFDASDENRLRARDTSERALQLSPVCAEAQVAHALSLCIFGEFLAADRAFEAALSFDPNAFMAWYFYARSKVQQGQHERAAELFDQAAKIRPEDYQCLFLKGAQLEKTGDLEAATKALREGLRRAKAFLELNPDEWRAWNLGAFAYQRLGQMEEAERWLEISLKNAPRDSTVMYNAACFYAREGKHKKALDCLDQAVGIGKISRNWVSNDHDLDSLRESARFQEIVARIPNRSKPPAPAAN